MAREIFGDVVKPSIAIGSQQWYTLPLSILAHAGIVAVLIVTPLMATDVLPDVPGMMEAFVATAPPPPPPPPPAPSQVAAHKPIVDVNNDAAPLEAPPSITRETMIVEDRVDTVSAGLTGLVDMPNGVPAEAPPPPAVVHEPVHVGGDIQPPRKIRSQDPTYPPMALSVKVQGIVILEATIGPDGRVQNVRVLRSIPLLDAAAIDAVQQWVYTPTLLNGVPVPVIMTVTVNFSLR